MGSRLKNLLLNIVVLIFFICKNYANEIPIENEEIDYRLPNSVIPKSYEIRMVTDMENLEFTGDVKIEALIKNETDKIILHHGNIEIQSYSVKLLKNNVTTKVSILNTTYDKKTEKYTIFLKKILEKDSKIIIAINSNGTLSDNMIGFYKSSYFDDKGNIKWLAATQFQATHARHAFPCFDEPGFKATFKVEISRTEKYKSLSNMPKADEKYIKEDKIYWDFYEISKPMSTYLCAFIIADFVNSKNGSISVWTRPEYIKQASYALDIGNKSLDYFNKLFDEPYHLEKLDMIALPDFAAGAMENWGLVTYKESRMLYSPDESSDSAQQTVASVIAHELAHNWFGNLVTPQWWDTLWLSEGFARYYEYFATAKIESTWKYDQQFVVNVLQNIFNLDGLDHSKPMTRSVKTTSDIGKSGDKITYDKGASIIRMMDQTFGSSTFNKAVVAYLKNNRYGSTVPDDLWNEIQKQIITDKIIIPIQVKTIMDSWTTQSGYPVVNVTKNKNIIKINQERFFIRNPKNISKNKTWWIPLTWTTKSQMDFKSTAPKKWFEKKTDKINLAINNDDLFILNIQQTGFYRVNYDRDMWYQIINVLKGSSFKDIHEINRAAIIDDLLNLARAGYISYDIALDGLQYIVHEDNYIPLKSAFVGLDYLEKRFAGQPNYELFANHILNLISRITVTLDFDDKILDNKFDILLRAEVNRWACKLNHKACIDKSIKHFSSFTSAEKPVPKNQRATVYCSSIRHGSHSDWTKLWDRYLSSDSAAEKTVILQSLGCSRNETTLENYLLSAIGDFEITHVRRQDSVSIFAAVSNSGLFGAEYILNFVDKYHLKMKAYYGSYENVAEIVATASERFSTQKLVDKFSQFIIKNKKSFESIIDQLNDSLELAKFELDWYKKNSYTILKWIRNNNYDNSNKYRLPTSIIPKSYKIQVIPELYPTFTFNGTVEIVTTVVEETEIVVFHTKEIEFINIDLSVNDTPLKIINQTEDKLYQVMIITLANSVPKESELLINISYKGQLNTEMRGFYRSSYVDDKNNTRWLASTHLEPVGARRMLPCFDEPGFKATFELSVGRLKDYVAVSNTKLIGSITNGDRILDSFEKTPVMSSYLLALIVSDFKKITDKKIYSAWARPNVIDQANYAVSVISPVINYFEKSLGHTYQLSKLDMAAIPDFASGAMENWGLITYKETNMLYHENHTPITSKQSIINVIAHEIAHQWFGNLVSPKWWSVVWLSEGFARYYQYHTTAKIESSWQLESQFIVEQLQKSFETDGLPSSHPMTHDVNTPSEISAIFDDISYAKGASVLRMIEKVIGPELFNKSLTSYLEDRKYNSVVPDNLFDAMQKQVDITKLNITKIMNTWTTQAGFPVVHVERTDKIINLKQERFLLKNPDNIDVNNTWWIPITWASKSNPDFSKTAPTNWLSSSTASITINNPKNEWFILNVQQSGYYRVNYDSDSWKSIIDVLKSDKFKDIHEINRAAIIDDLLNLARANYVDYSVALSATEYLIQETDYIPWRAAFNGFTYLNKVFAGKDIYNLYKTHILTSLKPIYKKLGSNEIKGESHVDKILRRYIFNWACEFNDQDCIDKSMELFAAWRANETQLVPVNLRNTVYCVAMKYGTVEDWEFLNGKINSTNVNTEKDLITSSLKCTKNSLISVLNDKNEIIVDKNMTRGKDEDDWYDLHGPRIFEWLDKKYPSKDYRLPTTVKPLKYKIYLTPFLVEKNFTFNGEVEIKMQAKTNVSSVVLHADKLTIQKITTRIDSVKLLEVSSYQLNSTTQKLTIYFNKFVQADTKFYVTIHYTGILNNKMEGFYRSSYEDNTGKTHWLASTQFEKFGARQAFPCFDEPEFKANFTVNIERPNEYHTRSNMALKSSIASLLENFTWDTYEESVPMSSYLVAFVVSDFVNISNEHGNFSVWARPNAIEDAQISLYYGEKSLSFLENYTGIEYPLSKVDMVAIPDFAAGAMENYGLVTFREYGLLVQEDVTSSLYLRYMATTIAHELVHFWFGDLVTCQWWDRLWLNEGFAEYLEWVVIDGITPEWKIMDQFAVYELQVALAKDSDATMRPMNNIMQTPYDSGEGNNAIIYGKAASVIHMMRCGFGEKIFQKGLNIYLSNNQYDTGTSEKLWSALQESADSVGGISSVDEDVEDLMNSWASQPGYPLLSVSVTEKSIELSQERFLITGKNESLETKPYWIPISYATKSEPNFNRTSPVFWFGKRNESFDNPDIVHDEWYIVNVKQSGFYRVNYNLENWENLIEALKHDNFDGIHEINRAQIIDDLLNMAQGKWVSYELALDATKYLENEIDLLPWRSFFNGVAYLIDRFEGQAIEPIFKNYILKLIENVYKEVGFVRSPLDSHMDGLKRQVILSWACKFDHIHCVDQSRSLFNQLKENKTKIDRDARPALYCTALKYGDYNDWIFLWEEYKKSNLESEKITILNSLGCSRNKTAIDYYFNILLSRDTAIRDQNVDLIISSVYKADGFGVNITLEYLMSNYKKLYDYYGSWNDVASIFNGVAGKISTQIQIDKLENFILETPGIIEISKSLNSSLMIARDNLEWYNNHSTIILSWLNGPTEPKPSGSNSIHVTGLFLTGVSFIFLIILNVTF
ncbi:uncharacterized protein LOC122850036 isoform X2 [Aphidius gifuensis]|nr:uncharacterized protein LOC122850036 isoform X2 [Aphidius gifuensis]